MKRVRIAAIILSLCTGIGCAYRGAVYSSYQQLALDIRATTEASTPIKVQLGYDRGVGAWVPKLNAGTTGATKTAEAKQAGNVDRGEAVSIISKDDIRSTATPPIKPATDAAKNPGAAVAGAARYDILTVDSAFITGMAANVAAAPEGVTVRVVVPLDPGSKEPERVVTSVTTDGDAGERIAMALSSAEAFDILQDLFDQIDALDPHRQDAIYDAAAILVSDEFHDAYVKRTRKMSRKIAFLKTRMDYVSGANKAKRRRETIDALRAALG